MNSNRNIEEILNKLGAEDVPADVHKIAEETSESFSRTLTQSRQHILWSDIMKSPITKLAAVAVIIIAVLIGIHQFGGTINGASVAWADMAKKVEQIQTCIFRGHTSTTGGLKGENARETEIEMFVSSECGFRADTYVDEKLMATQYTLPAEKVLIAVRPEQKKYGRMLLTDEYLRKMYQQGSDPREMVRQFMSLEYTELGRDTIDGVEVEGIETTDPRYGGGMFESFVGRLWVDVETDLPVRMETETQIEGADGLMKTSMVMDRFQWDVELEPSIFEPDIPADYTLMVDLKMPGQDEGSAVHGLRIFAEIAGGKYPSSMNIMKVVREVADAMKGSFDKESIEGHPNSKPSQEERDEMMKKVTEKIMSVQGACMFYAELVKADKDAAYNGDTVTAEDVDLVLMRWKISDDQYRVIFGDLTTENVTTEELAELEKLLPE